MYGRATARSAPNVVSRLTNSAACVSATGATMLAASASSPMKRGRFVSRLDRFRATGMMSRSSGRNAPIAWLRLCAAAGERVAEAAAGSCCAASRVCSSNMFTNSSNSTGAGVACASGIVSPSAKPSSDVPRVSSTYFRPSAERGRMISVESFGSGSTDFSSFRPRTAMLVPSSLPLDVDRVDRADARAADPHLVAAHEVGRARHLGLERVGRDERQALVGVVGQEHGDEHDEHRRRADQHRVAGDAAARRPSRHRPRTGSRAAARRARAVSAAGAGAALARRGRGRRGGRRRGGRRAPVRAGRRRRAPSGAAARRGRLAPRRPPAGPPRSAPACRGRRAGASRRPPAGSADRAPAARARSTRAPGRAAPSAPTRSALALAWRKFAEQPVVGSHRVGRALVDDQARRAGSGRTSRSR